MVTGTEVARAGEETRASDTWKLVVGGALAWMAVSALVWWARGSINFADRDDGIITLSHARHLVENGSIGVSAFGDRVAGFSTPLHFLVSLPYYAFGGEGYEALTRFIGFGTIGMVGALTGYLVASEDTEGSGLRRWVELGGALVLQMLSWSFFGWHFSGMENPLTTVLLMGVVAILPFATRSPGWMAATGTLLGLLAIARLDTITIVVPLVVLVLRDLWDRPMADRLRALVPLAVPPAVIGLATLASIYLYFGQLRSTTVDNRNRDIFAVVVLLALAVVIALVVVSILRSLRAMTRMATDATGRSIEGAWRSAWRSPEARRIALGVVVLIGCAAVAVLLVDTEVISSTAVAAYATGTLWTGLLLALAWCWEPLRTRRLHIFTVVALWVPLYEFVLGPTRLSLARVVSSAVPILSVATVVVLGRLWARRSATAGAVGLPRWIAGLGLAAVGLVGLTLAIDVTGLEPTKQTTYASTYNLCCTIEPRVSILLDEVESVVAEVDPAVTPIIANPDLGKMSYPAAVHIVDLGQIGDPLYLEVSTVPDEDEADRLVEYYLMEVYTPDLIQVGASWTCDLRPLMTTPAFQERYVRVDVGAASAPGEGDLNGLSDCDELGEVQNGVYVLRDPASRPDLVLASDLIAGRAEVGADFFEACARGDETECYVRMRAFRRAFPGRDGVEVAEAALENAGDGPEGRFVRAVIESPNRPGWSSDAFDALVEIEGGSRQ